METWKTIQRTVDYIEEHLGEKQSIDQLAQLAHLSPFYYQRIFTRLVGRPVREYIRLRRVAHGANLLSSSEKRVLDIALEVGFENHETFTRAFKAAYGLTPEQHRRQRRPLSHFLKPSISLQYLSADEDVPLIVDGMVLEVQSRTLSQPRHFACTATETAFHPQGPQVDLLGEQWARFHQIKGGIPGRFGKLPWEIGVGMAGREAPHSLRYLTGVEVAEPAAPPGLEIWSLPLGEYIVCCFEAADFEELTTQALNKAIGYMNGSWLGIHEVIPGPFLAELYPDSSPESAYMEIWYPKQAARNNIWNKLDPSVKPTATSLKKHVASPLWTAIQEYLVEECGSKPLYQYSGCSMKKGWNVKYKVKGRTLCTLYPMEGYFTSLVVIGERERQETELALPGCTKYLQQLYRDTEPGKDSRWLMIDVTSDEILKDVQKLVYIRRNGKR